VIPPPSSISAFVLVASAPLAFLAFSIPSLSQLPRGSPSFREFAVKKGVLRIDGTAALQLVLRVLRRGGC